ncbi:MAG: hypothetical protein LUD50_01210 [Clostridia bacterium]|nr:hypothetical protein [Clostridia bacterium]
MNTTDGSLRERYSVEKERRDRAIWAEWLRLTAHPSKKEIKRDLAARYGVSVNTINQILGDQRRAGSRRTANV